MLVNPLHGNKYGEQINVKVTDFGFASYLEPGKGLDYFCGSDDHMAPEIIQLEGNPEDVNELKKKGMTYNEKVDIWAIGIITFEMFTAETPFLDEEYE